MLREEGVRVGIAADVQAVPVIQARAAQVALVQREAQGTHEVQCAAGDAAGARDVSGILGDFGLEKDDVDVHEIKNIIISCVLKASSLCYIVWS